MNLSREIEMSSSTSNGLAISAPTMETVKDENQNEGPVARATPDYASNDTLTDVDAPILSTPLAAADPTTTTSTDHTHALATTEQQPPPPQNQSQQVSSQQQRLPYKYDPDKISLRFLFANRDGLTVTVTCNPSDTVGEVKGALISIWPKDVPNCNDGDDLRLICMGKGFLSPDSRTLQDCQIPTFKTHPTPINVSVKPSKDVTQEASSSSKNKRNQQNMTASNNNNSNNTTNSTSNYNTSATNNNSNNTAGTNNNNNHTTATSSSSTNRRTTGSNSPIETGQGCCIIS